MQSETSINSTKATRDTLLTPLPFQNACRSFTCATRSTRNCHALHPHLRALHSVWLPYQISCRWKCSAEPESCQNWVPDPQYVKHWLTNVKVKPTTSLCFQQIWNKFWGAEGRQFARSFIKHVCYWHSFFFFNNIRSSDILVNVCFDLGSTNVADFKWNILQTGRTLTWHCDEQWARLEVPVWTPV